MKPCIVILSTGLSLGGAEQQALYLARGLIAKDYAVKVVSLISLGILGKEALAEGLPIYSLEMARGLPDPRAIFRLNQWLKAWQPQAVIAFMVHATLLGRMSRLFYKTPVLVSSIRNEKVGGKLATWLFKLSNSADDACVVNSQGSADALKAQGVMDASKLKVIPNSLQSNLANCDLDSQTCLRRQLGLDDETFVWLAVGRLEPSKDYPNLLNALSRLAAEKVHLVIAGDGTLRESLQQLAKDLEVSNRVSFLGWRRDIPDLLTLADALVLSSAWEGMPNVLMEALSLARPVVATKVGGVTEVVQDWDSGFLASPGDAKALAQKMDRLMGLSASQRQLMGQRGQAYIQARHGPEKIVDLWEDLCLGLLAKQPPIPPSLFSKEEGASYSKGLSSGERDLG
ncbi:MAG: glycosyltransferase [Cyanobacteria bacterium P01_G01_bin.38]